MSEDRAQYGPVSWESLRSEDVNAAVRGVNPLLTAAPWLRGCSARNKWPECSISYSLETQAGENGDIVQTMKTDIPGMASDAATWVIRTRESSVRQALVELGWTPPEKELP